MTRDDVLRMAREVETDWWLDDTDLERFAALVADAEQKKWQDQTEVEIHEAVLDEREACAKVLESISNAPDIQQYAAAIRARGNT